MSYWKKRNAPTAPEYDGAWDCYPSAEKISSGHTICSVLRFTDGGKYSAWHFCEPKETWTMHETFFDTLDEAQDVALALAKLEG